MAIHGSAGTQRNPGRSWADLFCFFLSSMVPLNYRFIINPKEYKSMVMIEWLAILDHEFLELSQPS